MHRWLVALAVFCVTGVSADEPMRVLPEDAIRSIDKPRFERRSLPPDTDVLGLEVDGDARAYPVALLSRHEIVNDRVGGRPVAVTW